MTDPWVRVRPFYAWSMFERSKTMIRRLFTLVWAVAGRSKKIQDLVAFVWPTASVARKADVTPVVRVVAAPVAPAAELDGPQAAVLAAAVAAIFSDEPASAAEAPAASVPAVTPALVVADEAAEVVVADEAAAVVVAEAAPVIVVAEAPAVAEAAPALVVAEAPAAPAVVVTEAPAEPTAAPLRPLGQKEAIDGSVWVPRILWALEFAKLRDLGPQSASDISRVLGEHSGLKVPGPNVARAFRDRKQQGASYWKEVDEQRYEISRAGSQALRKQLRSGEN
jgi:hypothetical protein